MGIVYILIPLALLLSGAATCAYLWAVRNEQFDDLEAHGFRVLFDDDEEESS